MELKELHNSIIYLNKSIIAGMMIGIGGVIYLHCPNTTLGAFMFSIGLLTIMIFQANLFTGQIGNAKVIDTFNMLLCLLGNYIGTLIVAKLIQNTRIYSNIFDRVNNIVSIKLQDNCLSLFLLAIMCGVLMNIAVSSYRKHSNIIGVIVAILCVATFILSGFEHCIADMFYFNLYKNIPSPMLFFKLIVIILGNTIGAKIINFYIKEN